MSNFQFWMIINGRSVLSITDFHDANDKYVFSGDMHMITLTDMFGFECFHRNRTEQLMINSLNEQIQYHYNQRMFVWEMMEQVSELLIF